MTNLLRELPRVAPDLELRRGDAAPRARAGRRRGDRAAGALAGAADGVVAPAPAAAARGPSSRTSSTRCRSATAAASVLTLHDLSFERDPALMGRLDRLTFKAVVPRSARRADRVLAVSERTKRDVVELYGVPAEKVTVTPNAVDPAFFPARMAHAYTCELPALRRRDPGAEEPARRARRRARPSASRSSSPGPEKDAALAGVLRDARRRPARLRREGRARRPLPRRGRARCSRRATRASACPCSRRWRAGRRSSSTDDEALREVGGDAAVYAADGDFAGAVRRALAERDAPRGGRASPARSSSRGRRPRAGRPTSTGSVLAG